MSLEAGATATYNVLPDFIDPEGDTLFLKSAEGDGTDVVDFTPDGMVTVTANPDVQGVRTSTVVVSDGREDVEASCASTCASGWHAGATHQRGSRRHGG